MQRYFNTTGSCFLDEHYMLPPERRLGRVMELIERGKYFTLHAGRQTGKTTSAQWLAEHYNAGDRFCAVWFDVETARDQPDRVKAFTTSKISRPVFRARSSSFSMRPTASWARPSSRS